jgi:hypothetical protein
MTIFDYIAYSNPLGAKQVLDSFGMRATRKPEILARQLANCVNQHKAEAMFRIAAIHPDRELITEFNAHNQPKEIETKSSNDKEEVSLFSSAEGQAIKSAVEDLKRNQEISNQVGGSREPKSEKSELLIIGAIALVGLALVLKK